MKRLRSPFAPLLVLSAAIGIASACSKAVPPAEPEPAVPAIENQPLVTATGDASGDPTEPGWGIIDKEEKMTYGEVVARVTGMVGDRQTSAAVRKRGLNLMNLTWEDTGRSMGSSVGPNISDLTLQVRYTDHGAPKAALLPVIRFPNFEDRTGDIPADRFMIRVGNQKKGGAIETVSLTDVLKDVKKYVSNPSSIKGSGNLFAARDSHFLASAQAVFLPIPKEGHAEFTPVLFNYQSFPGSPAVLTMLVTRQGTSITVIENKGDEMSPAASWGQELYFNQAGERAPFTAERRTDVVNRIEAQGGPKNEDDRSAIARGSDVLFIVQVPLKHRPLPRTQSAMGDGAGFGMGGATKGGGAAAPAPPMATAKPKSDVEQAVLGHGKAEGPFSEGRNFALVRDDKFPIRVTVQFYKATSNGVVDESDLDKIASTIGDVYEHADFVGSLVIPDNDAKRPTAWQTGPGFFAW